MFSMILSNILNIDRELVVIESIVRASLPAMRDSLTIRSTLLRRAHFVAILMPIESE